MIDGLEYETKMKNEICHIIDLHISGDISVIGVEIRINELIKCNAINNMIKIIDFDTFALVYGYLVDIEQRLDEPNATESLIHYKNVMLNW